MALKTSHIKYVPSGYARKRPGSAQRVADYCDEWQARDNRKAVHPMIEHGIGPTITLSRKIGVGAVEVADLIAGQIDHKVVDREVIDHIAADEKFSLKSARMFDEAYPGKFHELQHHLFGKEAFSMAGYTKRLFSVIYAMAETCPTIFIGRGAHLILPREKVLAVRIISSPAYRIERVAKILEIDHKNAETELKRQDKEQKAFFKRVFNRKSAATYEFDLVVNLDYIKDPQWVADIVLTAYRAKFAKVL